MEQIKSTLEKLLLRANSVNGYTDDNRRILSSIFSDFKPLIVKLNESDPNTFSNLADTSDIEDRKDLIITTKSAIGKKNAYNTFKDYLIHLIEMTIDRL